MSEPTARDDARSCTEPARVRSCYCDRCDLLVGLPGVHVVAVEEPAPGRLQVVVETPAAPMGCRSCGVVAVARGRRAVSLVDVPCGGRAVRLIWRKRTWRCPEPADDVHDEKHDADGLEKRCGTCRWTKRVRSFIPAVG